MRDEEDRALLFVYGTLKRGQQSPMAPFMQTHFDFVGRGSVAGRLWNLGRYPGLTEGEGLVHGEVLRARANVAWNTLDEYEGDEYRRVRNPVTLETGEVVVAWMYLYCREVGDKEQLLGGAWY